MTPSAEVLTDGFDRIRQAVQQTLDGITTSQLAFRPTPTANSAAWLIWHLTRVQDDHVSELAEVEQRWTANHWDERFALPFDDSATGYGQSSNEVGALSSVSAEMLVSYYDDVHSYTVRFLSTLTDADLSRVIDSSWDPPVTLGVRLVSVISDDLQHAGQAEYLRGIAD